MTETNASQANLQNDQPLGLTVHSMPPLEQVLSADSGRILRGRWKMLVVMLVCAAPVIASYLTYYLVRPEGRRNFGELIVPQRALPDLQVLNLDGQSRPLQLIKGQWLLVSVAPGACDARCLKNLYWQRQLRESLGREKDRLDWVWLVNDEAPVSEAMRLGLSDATVLRLTTLAIASWLQPADGHGLSEHLYLIDPQGNWMMRFPAELDLAGAAKVKRDLERLLRASASWDKAGR